MLFVDDGTLAPFVRLATALRRARWRTIRVTTASRSIGSIHTASFAFDRVVHTDELGVASLDSLLAGEHLVDVDAAEPLAVSAYRSLARPASRCEPGWMAAPRRPGRPGPGDAAPGRRWHRAPRRTGWDDPG